MLEPKRLAQAAVCCCLLMFVLPCAGSASAEAFVPYAVCNAQRGCIPNAEQFGYFQTMWRRWPGDFRPTETFPRSINAEVVPTPSGEQPQQLPRTRLRPQAQETLEVQPETQPDRLPGLPEGFLPGGGPGPQEPGFQLNGGAGQLPGQPGAGSMDQLLLGTPAPPTTPPSSTPGPMDILPGLPAAQPSPTPLEPPLQTPMTRPGGAEMPKLSPPIVQQPANQPSTDQNAATLPKPQIVDPTEPKVEPVVEPLVKPVVEPLVQSVVEPLVEPVVASVAAKPADQVQVTRPEETTQPAPAKLVQAETSQPAPAKMPVALPVEPAVATSTKVAPVLVAVSPTAAAQESGNLPATKLPTAALPPAELASAERPKPLPLRANWIGALNPGFRGDTGRATAAYHSTVTRPEPAGPAASSGPVRTGGQLAGYNEQVAPETVNRPKTAETPPVTLDGFCPVELVTQETWTRGDPRWTAAYQGRTYMFAGQTQRQKFLEHPERFTPAYSGNDTVFAVDGKRQMPGKTDYCVTYQGRLYMFSSSLTLSRFQANPQHYAVSDRP